MTVDPTEPRQVELDLPAGKAAALVWGPEEGPLAVLLHGFPDSPWGWRKVAPALADRGWRVVSMAVPPLGAIRPTLNPRRLAGQARRSWYIAFVQLPGLSERALERLVPRLWRDWSPGYDPAEDVSHALDAIRGRESAVLGYYRAMARPVSPPAAYRSWHRSGGGGPSPTG